MVASTYMRVMDQKVVFTPSIYIVEVSNEVQGLLMDIRKKNMINMINVIMTLVTIKPLEWRPFTFGFCFKQKSVQFGLSCSKIRVSSSTIRSEPQVCRNEQENGDWLLRTEPENGGYNFSDICGSPRETVSCCSRKLSMAFLPPLSRSRTSATVKEKGSDRQDKLQFYGPPTVHYPLYRGRHPHIRLKS